MHSHPPSPFIEPRRFTSLSYPDGISWRWTFTRAFIRPLMTCMLPIMVGALIAMLQGYPALAFLTVGFPIAVLLASVWTLFRLQATTAEIYVRPGAASIRSVRDCFRKNHPLHWVPILDLRSGETSLTLSLGDTTYELDRTDWPDADVLLKTLVMARQVPFFSFESPV